MLPGDRPTAVIFLALSLLPVCKEPVRLHHRKQCVINTAKCSLQQLELATLTGPKGEQTLLAYPKCSPDLQKADIVEVDDGNRCFL